MTSYVRELVGDLIVATTELVDAGAPPDERWPWLALTCGAAVRANPHEAPADLIDTLGELVWETPFGDAVLARARDAGAWRERSAYRSALELMRALFPDQDIDTSVLEIAMIADGPGAFAATAAPDGMPEHHWWWRAPGSPGRLRVNDAMSAMLALGATRVPPGVRRVIAGGFVHHGEDDRLIIDAHLPRDDSRRPVDLAGIALACARWLAAELRREVAERCQIIAVVSRQTMTAWLSFHVAPDWGLDRLPEDAGGAGMLALDSK